MSGTTFNALNATSFNNLVFNRPAALVDVGTMPSGTATTSTIEIGSSVTNGVNSGGTIAFSGTLTVASLDPSGSDVFQLSSPGTLQINGALGSYPSIQFLANTSADELIINSAATFGQHIGSAAYFGPLLEGFVVGDVIDLKDIAPSNLALSYSVTSGDLQITGSIGNALATLSFQNATLGTGSFHSTSDGSGGTLITHS